MFGRAFSINQLIADSQFVASSGPIIAHSAVAFCKNFTLQGCDKIKLTSTLLLTTARAGLIIYTIWSVKNQAES